MADRRAVLRVVDELLWSLRRGGFVVAPSQAIDVVRALDAVGLDDRATVERALAAVLVKRRDEQARFLSLVRAFFAAPEASTSLWDRLAAAGFTEGERATLRELLEAMASTRSDGAYVPLGALLERGPELSRLLQTAGIRQAIAAAPGAAQLGFFRHRIVQRVGVEGARQRLAALAGPLRDALGTERSEALLAALAREIDAAEREVRAHVKDAVLRREESERDVGPTGGRLEARAFAALTDDELEGVRRAVRLFAERLRGGERVRRKRARRGGLDVHRTLRAAMRTGGVPFVAIRRRRRRDRARLFLLCDVSDSVRDVATFLLEFVYAAQELFERARSFVFVSELGETTELFAREPVRHALARAYGGAIVPVTANSNYGRVLRSFETRHLRDLTRRDTVVLLGDGRTNFHEAAEDVLPRIRARARALLWLCPEPRSRWGQGDSAMARYAPLCTKVLEVRTARDLEDAARTLLRLR